MKPKTAPSVRNKTVFRPDFQVDLDFRVLSNPRFPQQAGLTAVHLAELLAGTAQPSAALLAALYPPDPDDDCPGPLEIEICPVRSQRAPALAR